MLVDGDRLDQPLDDVVGLEALGLGVEVGDDPVPQHRARRPRGCRRSRRGSGRAARPGPWPPGPGTGWRAGRRPSSRSRG